MTDLRSKDSKSAGTLLCPSALAASEIAGIGDDLNVLTSHKVCGEQSSIFPRIFDTGVSNGSKSFITDW